MKVEVAVWASVPNKPTVSVDVKQHFNGGSRRGRLPDGGGGGAGGGGFWLDGVYVLNYIVE